MIHIRFPEYDRCSGDLRLANMLRLLARHHNVTLHILYKSADYLNTPENKKYRDLMQELSIEVRNGSLRGHLRDRSYDAVVIEFWYVARHLFREIRALQPAARIVVDTEHIYFHSNQLKAKALNQDPNSAELTKVKREELQTYGKADLIVATTLEDKQVLLAKAPGLAIAIIPNIHDVPPLDDAIDDRRKPNSLIFVGNFANNPSNVDAMIHFCAETLPLIRRRVSDATLTIVGNKPPLEIQALACQYVTVTGYVPKTTPYIASSMVSICPLRYGAGLKGKIGEAMLHGLPVVTTSIGTQGMDVRLGIDILVGDTSEEFADCVVRLLQQPPLWKTLSRNGYRLVVRNYSLEAVGTQIDKMIAELGALRLKHYAMVKRLVLKASFDAFDLLDQYVLWRLMKPEH